MKKTIILFMLCLIVACSEHDFINSANEQLLPITLSSTYPSVQNTRATIDGGFVTGDQMGVFIVDYVPAEDGGEKNTPGIPMIGGGRGSNLLLSLQEDGTWASNTPIYWTDMETPADFYGYYPFDNNMSSVTAYPFSVAEHQNNEESMSNADGYAQSDLLRAKSTKVWPTKETVNLQFKHLMAGVLIRLEMGTGFTASEWAELEKTVLVQNTLLSGEVNLVTGETTVNTSLPSKSIVPLIYNGNWRALVFPQTVETGKTLVNVTIDGHNYLLKKQEPMTYYSGKMHQFTITVNRSTDTGQFTFTFADEGILPWENDADLHEGLVYQYLTVHIDEPGTLEQVLKQKFGDPTKIESLKITGNISNAIDIEYMHSNMFKLQNLNLLHANMVDEALTWGWDGNQNTALKRVAFPEKGVKLLGGFINCGIGGSLIIPEGVEETGWHAFSGNPLFGIVSLPSTLKYTDYLCEYNDQLHGELILPEGLITWGGIGGNYTGSMNIPSSLKEINGPFPAGLTGTIVIPPTLEKMCPFAFAGSQCTSVVLPEGMTTIPNAAFGGSELRGELRIPSTVTFIDEGAFGGTKISSVILPKDISTMGASVFEGCTRLQGTITIPKKITHVPIGCFSDCLMLTGVIFHKDVYVIDNRAFEGCNNLNSIICEGEDPPAVVGDAFLGVPKDNFTVEVPKGCVEKYRQARGWSEFKRIAEHSGFVCRPAQVQALNNVHNDNLILNADGDWTVKSKPDWVTLSATNGTGKAAINMAIKPLSRGAGNRQDDIVFEMQKGNNKYETHCTVSQYDYEYDEDGYLTLQKATKGNNGGIDIVFVGDGYDGASISDGTYLDLIKYQAECFFAVEPYKSMRNYFNVYVTFPLSQEKGVNTMYTYVNNRFGTLYGMSSLTSSLALSKITSNQLITESDEVMDYAVSQTPLKAEDLWRSLVILVPNSTDYEGHTEYASDGRTLCICPPSEQPYPRDTRGVMQHEAGGHGFGKLGDETIIKNAFATIDIRNYIEGMHERGWFANLSTTGKLNSVPWAEFIFDTDYSDYVDVYEGGYGYTRGVYRPEANSCMNYGIPYYNTPSRLAIYRRILDYAGEDYTMERFRAQDTFEWGATTITRSSALPDRVYATGNHQMPTITNFREMGNKVRQIRERLKKKIEKK